MNPKTKRILMWVGIGLLAMQFAAASLGKLTGGMQQAFINWGYNTTFMYVIGVLELLGAIGIFIKSQRTMAAYGLIGLMIGAAYTHLTHDETIRVVHNLIIALVAFGVVRLSKE